MTITGDARRAALLRRGFALEYATLSWNVAGIVVLAIAAITARSVALAGFGLGLIIEIGASAVVIWELSGTGEQRQRRALRLIGYAFAALAVYLLVQSTVVLAAGYRPRHSLLGIAWTAVTAAAMFALAVGKARTGRALGNPVLQTEGRVTLIDGILSHRRLARPGAECSGRTVAGRSRSRVRARRPRCAGGAGDLHRRPLTPAGEDAPGWHAHPQDSPAQARRPSITAHPAMPSATAGVEPPGAQQRVGGQAGEDRHGQVGAQQVLRSLPRSGRRPEPRADPPFGHPEAGLEDGGARGEHQPGERWSQRGPRPPAPRPASTAM